MHFHHSDALRFHSRLPQAVSQFLPRHSFTCSFLQLPLTFSILLYQRKHINNAVYHRCIFINLHQNCEARSVSSDARIASSYPIHIRFISTQEKGPGTGLELCASFFLLVMSHMWSVPQGGKHSFPFEQYIVVKLLEKYGETCGIQWLTAAASCVWISCSPAATAVETLTGNCWCIKELTVLIY